MLCRWRDSNPHCAASETADSTELVYTGDPERSTDEGIRTPTDQRLGLVPLPRWATSAKLLTPARVRGGFSRGFSGGNPPWLLGPKARFLGARCETALCAGQPRRVASTETSL